MRKHLIGAILVLAALAACNKEVDTPAPAVDNGQEEVTPGKVTLTFKATIDEGTRTSYDENLQGSWLPNDAISVCVTDRKNNYQTAVFTTEDGEIFSGQVSAEYTTIVSGVYPANDKHVFDLNNGKVTSVYLSDTYSLGTANDEGTALPMVGEMEEGVFTFHHICGALKIEVVDIFNALTFTTASENITGVFNLDDNGRLAMPATNGGGKSVTFNYDRLSTNPTDRERNNRTFFIPIPDGTVNAGAKMQLKNSENKVVFEKTTPIDIAFRSNIIKRLSPISFKTPDDWSLNVQLNGIGKPDVIYNENDQEALFIRYLARKSKFIEDYQGSVAAFIEEKLLSYTAYPKPEDTDFPLTMPMSNNVGIYYDYDEPFVILICGVTSNSTNGRKLTFEFCLLEKEFDDPATTEYLAWLGDWQVTEDTETNPKTDTWTITRGATNSSYVITGLVGQTSIEAQGVYSSSDHSLTVRSQEEIGTYNANGKTVSLLRRSNSTGNILTNSGEYFNCLIAKLLLNNGEVTISGTNYGYGYYWKNNEDKWASLPDGSLKRVKFKPLIRVE